MKFQVLALIDGTVNQWLERCIGDKLSMDVVNMGALREKISSDSHYRFVLIQVGAFDRDERLQLIKDVADQHPDLTVIAIGTQADSSTVLACMRAGAEDFLLVDQDDDRIQELMTNAVIRGADRKPRNTNLIAILSGHSDSGMAFLAEHLAQSFCENQRQNEAVLLLDLASPAGAAAVFMNVQNEYSALDAISDAYRCDATLVDTAFGKHRRGAFVLSLPELLEGPPVIDTGELSLFLDVASTLFTQIIVCADRWVGESAIQAIASHAHHNLITCDQSILSSRHNQQMLRSMRSAGVNLDSAGLVVDRYQRKVGLEPEKLAELLQLPLHAVLAGDPANRLKAMNAGDSLFDTASSDEYLRGLRRLSQQMLGRSQMEPHKRTFFEKLLS